MLKVPPSVTKCVCFVGSRRDAKEEPRFQGTAFFIGRGIEKWPDRYLGFAVTAKHVIDAIKRSGEQLCLRLTLRTDPAVVEPFSLWVDFPMGDWVEHPDPTVDAVIMPMKTLHMFDLEIIFPRMTLTDHVIEEEGIGVGTEVFMTGLFVNHPGKDRNLPIVRVGNIAAMPDEKVYTPPFGDMDAFLIEARSIGGLSGSPAFVHLGVVKIAPNKVKDGKAHLVWATDPSGVFYWMGLVHGHYDSPLTRVDEGIEDAAITRERVNMGIAIVVPATRILEIFREPRRLVRSDCIVRGTGAGVVALRRQQQPLQLDALAALHQAAVPAGHRAPARLSRWPTARSQACGYRRYPVLKRSWPTLRQSLYRARTSASSGVPLRS